MVNSMSHATDSSTSAAMLEDTWDVIVVGGGITGAGILKLASQLNCKALLLEQRDFAFGSSSRSSKMVHGGLRYIAEGYIRLTRESVRERDRLMEEAEGLVEPQSFVMSHYSRRFPGPFLFGLLLKIYNWFAQSAIYRQWKRYDYSLLVPGVSNQQLLGGTQFSDAMTDDARMVLRLIQEAESHGAKAVNYTQVTGIHKQQGIVNGVTVVNQHTGQSQRLKAKVVINATGAWADQFSSSSISQIKMRPLRGSHVIIPAWRLAVGSATSVLHPDDNRPVVVFPWMNVTVIGTTDVEHDESLQQEAHISQDELDYLLKAVNAEFPDARISPNDILSTFAGVRPVVASGKKIDASKENREHAVWQEPGLISVAGGKLTTFRVIAREVITLAAAELDLDTPFPDFPAFDKPSSDTFGSLSANLMKYLAGRYGEATQRFITEIPHNLLTPVSYTPVLWGELVWACRYEQVSHLDDLLLRRTRLGILLPEGAIGLVDEIKNLCKQELNWNEEQWQEETTRYQDIWRKHYSLPAA